MMRPQRGLTTRFGRLRRVSDLIPEGFTRHFRQSPATDPWEPLWSKKDDGVFRIGLIVAPPHCNARGFVHGGILSALADNCMGLACVLALGSKVSMVTVNLSVDYLGVAPQGAWLEFVGSPSKLGRTLCFASANVTANGETVARASAIFRVVARPTPPKEGTQNG
jgi:uncharacterized protein (TIGR00369 family)